MTIYMLVYLLVMVSVDRPVWNDNCVLFRGDNEATAVRWLAFKRSHFFLAVRRKSFYCLLRGVLMDMVCVGEGGFL